MIENGSPEYYQIWAQENLLTWIARIRLGYLPYLDRDCMDGECAWLIDWRK